MTPEIVSLEASARRPVSVAESPAPAWTRSSTVAVVVTAGIALTGVLGGKIIASVLGLFIGWAAVFAVAVIAAELFGLARIMARIHARHADGRSDYPEQPVRRAA